MYIYPSKSVSHSYSKDFYGLLADKKEVS